MKTIRSAFVVLLITLTFSVVNANANTNFVTVNLTKGVTVELPKNWVVMSDNKRVTLDTWRESMLEAHKLKDAENDLPFAANYYDDTGNSAGSFAIRFYPNIVFTQSEAIAADSEFIQELDAGIRENFVKGYEASGGHLVVWLGTKKETINGSVYFISESRQRSPQGFGFTGFLVRYLNAGNSFTIMISYREDKGFYLRPICEKIISSVKQQ
ncbi:hypothetical protein [Methyloglobulus sp.]|uniref:hypothetical protein n=1 Tax=Methyloglobulus sp. TaxID=2518622 RepID=UPI0032B869C6